ncbi:MAG: YggT family protein [Halioglobus sp.]|nr:YggT family protein [Halioglobus sp.]
MDAFNDILNYVLQTLLGLYLFAMLLRFLLQLVRADFYNPISQFLVKITNPLVLPLRKIIPGFGGLDLASLVLALLLQMLSLTLLLLLKAGAIPAIDLLLVGSVIGLAALILQLYFFAILAMIILSWVAPGGNNPAVILLYQLTEPAMAPFRKVLPAMGGLDLSPILVFIVIGILQRMLGHAAAALGVLQLIPWL